MVHRSRACPPMSPMQCRHDQESWQSVPWWPGTQHPTLWTVSPPLTFQRNQPQPEENDRHLGPCAAPHKPSCPALARNSHKGAEAGWGLQPSLREITGGIGLALKALEVRFSDEPLSDWMINLLGLVMYYYCVFVILMAAPRSPILGQAPMARGAVKTQNKKTGPVPMSSQSK